MAFDISSITGAVNNYLTSISDTSKLLTQKESENALDPSLSGLFEKYLTKAIKDETDGTKAVSEVAGNSNSMKPAEEVRRVDTDIPFPKFDIGNMIADSIASHSRFSTDTFAGAVHQPKREASVKSIDPFYTNMVRSSIFDVGNTGEDTDSIDSKIDIANNKIGKERE